MNNPIILQAFHWYYPADGSLWKHLAAEAANLSAMGLTHLWLPPAYKSAEGDKGVGYAVYDHFDLGEFDQKGSVGTKYGTRDQYLKCIEALHANKLLAVADIVLNHKQGADETETVPVQKTNPDNRLEFLGEPHEADVYTKYTFPKRHGKYSDYVWDWNSFTGIDAQVNDEYVIYKILNRYGPDWDEVIEEELGNFDYLMGADLELRNPYVKEELKKWGKWYVSTAHIDGFRLDAVKHMSPSFVIEWLDYLREEFNHDFFCMAEYWSADAEVLKKYIDRLEGRTHLLDVPLHFKFEEAGKKEKPFDLREMTKGVLLETNPERTITFVDNHDTQPFQALQSTVADWFKPLAYAFMLLRIQGIPCVFYPDLYGAAYEEKDEKVTMQEVKGLRKMMKARTTLAYGEQKDFFVFEQLIGWVRMGLPERKFSGLAVLLNTNDEEGQIEMEMGSLNAGARYRELNGSFDLVVEADRQGNATFPVKPASVAIWVREEALSMLK